MVTQAEHDETLRAAEKDFGQAQTADDIRKAWRKYYLSLGHRTLGRLLLGRSAEELIIRRQAKSD